MSNCVVGSVGLRLPGSIIAEHSVEGSDHFSHDGDDDDLGFFVGVGEAIVEGLEGGTEPPASVVSGVLKVRGARAFNTSGHIPIHRVAAAGDPSYSPYCGLARCLC